MTQPLTISQLEKLTGVGRSTIYYYIAEGLLPPAQKSSATRAVYARAHVELLGEIAELKSQGLTLKQIRDAVAGRVKDAAETSIDLVSRRNDDTRRAILQAAARRFAELGYDRTRIGDICKEVGVTAQLLYTHFPSKRHLFIECYTVYFEWMHDQIEPVIEETDDAAARLAWRSWASLSIHAFSPDLQAMARVEAFQPESELRPLVRDLYERILSGTLNELAAERHDGDPGLLDDELVAYAFLGALENMEMRASWDDKYTRQDMMRNLVVMFMAVRGALTGRLDLSEEWREMEPLIERLASRVLNDPAGGTSIA